MITDTKMFMELNSQYEEMKVMAETYVEISDIAYKKAIECYEQNNLAAYKVWIDLIDICDVYLDDINTMADEISEKLQDIVIEEP